MTTEYITVEAVNAKPKFGNAGGLLVNESWVNVAGDVKMSSFEKGGTYAIEMGENAKGYKVITKVIEGEGKKAPPRSLTGSKATKKEVDWDKKDRDKMIGGIGHDVAAMIGPWCQGLSPDEVANLYEEVLIKIIAIRDKLS